MKPYICSRRANAAQRTGRRSWASRRTRAGQASDALAVLHGIGLLPYKAFAQLVLGAGYRAVVTLVTAGDVAGARAIQAELAPRFARVGTKPD